MHNHELLDIAFTFDFCQVVNEFTRVQGDSKSILDLVFVNGEVGNNYEYEVVDGISDHSAVLLSLSNINMLTKVKESTVLKFAEADDVSVLDLLDFEFDKFHSLLCLVVVVPIHCGCILKTLFIAVYHALFLVKLKRLTFIIHAYRATRYI
ncbi:unnamed protein product [Ixodes hexagonus]